MIKRQQYSVLESACGIKLDFSELLPRPDKIASISSASRTNGVVSLNIRNLSKTLKVGDRISISQTAASLFEIDPIPDSYIGTFAIDSVSNDTITFLQDAPNEINTGTISADLLEPANIEPAENYTIDFSVVTKVPPNAEINIRPPSYIVSGYDKIIPTTIIEIRSRFSTTVKTLLKMVVKNFVDNKSIKVLKTEFIELIMSDSSTKPCEIIYENPIETNFYVLNKQNNWSYYHEGYLLAQFIPINTYINQYPNLSIEVVKKNNQLLPNKGDARRVRIIADPIKLQDKKVSVEQIRSAILNQYETINNSIAVANLGNKSYDIIVEDKLIKPDDLKDLVVAIVPPQTGIPVKFSEVAIAKEYEADIVDLPSVSFLSNTGIGVFGELHYNTKIYNRDPIILYPTGNLTPPSSVALSGNILDVTNGLNFLFLN
jgi:hypothetical protein